MIIRLFFPRQEVPEWLESVHPDPDATTHSRGSLKFGSVTLCWKWKGSYYLLSLGKCMVLSGAKNVIVKGGGNGVVFISMPTIKSLTRKLIGVVK